MVLCNRLTARKKDLYRNLVHEWPVHNNELDSKINPGMNNSDIMEWRIQLRDNELSIGEENVKAKKKKLEQEEKALKEHLAMEKREREERERKLAEQEQEVRRHEFEFREKNAILEILLKVYISLNTERFYSF